MDKNFIKATESACSFDNHVAAPYIRKSFSIPFKPEKAIIDICGLGFYELYINGSRITKGALAPYISNPEHYCYIDEYDVTKYLLDGENVVGVILGNGFFNSFGGAIWDFDKAPWTGAPVLALEFTAESAGNRYNFSADESFKIHSSPIIFDELRMGEYYDASKELDGWSSPGFDDSAWKNATVAWDIIREDGIRGTREFSWHRTPGFGDTNWADVITILMQNGYKGAIDIEGYHDVVHYDDLEWSSQVASLEYLKRCRGGAEFFEGPKEYRGYRTRTD